MARDPLTNQRRLLVRKRVRFFVDRYDVLNRPARDPIAFAAKKYSAPEVAVYRDDSQSQKLFTVKATHEHTPLQGLEVTGRDGPVGVIRADAGFKRRVWHLEQGELTVTGRERSALGAFFRAVSCGWLASHIDFTAGGEPAFTAHRKFGLRTRYVVDIADERLDRRLVVAQVVVLNEF